LELQQGCSDLIDFVTIQGSIRVQLPNYRCRSTRCGAECCLHPLQLHCFPSTPLEPNAFYDADLLQMTSTSQAQASYAANAWHSMLEHQFADAGLLPTHAATLTGITGAAQHWARVQKIISAKACAATPLLCLGMWDACPCCWRECLVLSGDACLGLRRFGKAASSSTELQPFTECPFFLAEEQVAEALRSYKPAAGNEKPACGPFKAATVVGRKTSNYDRQGVVAFVCRHGFVAGMTSLLTNENFLYYELLLKFILPKINASTTKAIFLDIACKFEGWWRRR
jgi:hypothetical protein